MATNGSDNNSGSANSPYATLTKAISSSVNGGTVVVHGGTYRQGNFATSTSRSIKIIAYPGEIPIFNGAQLASGNWVAEGSLKYYPYTPLPVTVGSGIDFPNGANLNGDFVGKYPDQAWVGDKELKQVTNKSELNNNDKFWVDQTNNRLYMTATNANQPNVEVSDIRKFMNLKSPNSTLEGIRIMRYSDTASDHGAIRVDPTADNSIMKNIEIFDTAYLSMQFAGGSDQLTNNKLQNITVEGSNWMGIGASYTDNLLLDSVKISNLNSFSEFKTSPQSGTLKTSRTRYAKVLNSVIKDNLSHGIWFDQSNVDVDMANNTVTGNTGTGVFFEISDDFLMINNYVSAPSGGAQAVKLAGSSGVKLINNTIIGGKDPIGIYVDYRSKPGCSDPSKPLCATSYNSDRDLYRNLPSTLDWMPRIDLMINNIIAYPQAAQYCGGITPLCITHQNGDANQPIENIIHKAEPGRGIPQTIMNGNVYANGSSNIIRATDLGNYSTISQLTSAMAGSPVNISGIESNGKYGNQWVNPDGSSTSALTAKYNEAVAIPNDPNINQYLSAGLKRYGVVDN